MLIRTNDDFAANIVENYSLQRSKTKDIECRTLVEHMLEE